jgi:hypothetical protein
MEGTSTIDNHLKFVQKKSERSTVIFYIFKKSKREKLKNDGFSSISPPLGGAASAARIRRGLTTEPVLPRVPTNIPTKFDRNRLKDG